MQPPAKALTIQGFTKGFTDSFLYHLRKCTTENCHDTIAASAGNTLLGFHDRLAGKFHLIIHQLPVHATIITSLCSNEYYQDSV